jgi:hypothetical protein
MTEGEASWESVKGKDIETLKLDVEKEFAEAIAAVKKAGLPWYETTILKPKEKLVKLVEDGQLAIGTKAESSQEDK